VVDRGLRGDADHGVHELVGARARLTDDLADQVGGRLEVALDVVRLVVAELQDARGERTVEAAREAMVQRFVAEQDVLLQELPADDVLRITDVRGDRHPLSVARRHGGPRRAEVDAEVEDAGLGLLLSVVRGRHLGSDGFA
jgi:hypothetical protein